MTSDLAPPTSDLGLRPSEPGLRFALRTDVALEHFGERSLALLCNVLTLCEINASGQQMLELLDGKRTVQDIASKMGVALEIVRVALLEMEQQGVVRRIVNLRKERCENMSEARYLADPDVSFRQEDNDGGLLYNAETDTLEVINPVAVEIWKFLAAPHTQAEVIDHLLHACEGVPHDQVGADVTGFLDGMIQKGFIGVVEEPV